jgi:YgiT-type zinc finger domain-containing protein
MGTGFQEKEAMRCIICKQGETLPGKTTVTLERDSLTLVIKNVPAGVCENCGEEYIDEEITRRLLSIAEEAAQSGVQVDIRSYIAA